jgi:hypothetical protein
VSGSRSDTSASDSGRLADKPLDSGSIGAEAPEHRPRSSIDQTGAFDPARFPDGFYVGVIASFDRVRGRGVIRSQGGREIRFEFPFVSVIGAPIGRRFPGIELLHLGDTVGFDVGWTSKGLRITKIKPRSG